MPQAFDLPVRKKTGKEGESKVRMLVLYLPGLGTQHGDDALLFSC